MIEGGTGSDRIDAGAGDDEVIGGNGSDLALAGPGTDTVFGERGNDHLYGGPGDDDYLSSGLGDDTVDGGPGNGDHVIGGVGNDHLSGGPGNDDVLEGDLGTDTIGGDPGAHDTASYALAGQSAIYSGGIGVDVRLAAGTASGDGEDTLSGIEDVVGTPFADTIAGDAEPNELYGGGGTDELIGAGAADAAFGGTGLDLCREVAIAESCELSGGRADNAADEAALLAFEEHPPPPPTFEVDLPGDPDTGELTGIVEHGVNLVDKQGIQVHVALVGDSWVVTERLPMAVGEGCSVLNPETASCPIATTPTGLFLNGGEGADLLAVEPSVPATVSARLIGGNGADTLIGGAGDDSLDGSSGPGNGDQLYGGAGDDALAEGSVLDGEGGSDLLVAAPCGETIDGGPGIDSVSFARSTYEGVETTLGGTAGIAPPGSFPGGCPTEHGGPPPSQISSSVERIEGSPTTTSSPATAAATSSLAAVATTRSTAPAATTSWSAGKGATPSMANPGRIASTPATAAATKRSTAGQSPPRPPSSAAMSPSPIQVTRRLVTAPKPARAPGLGERAVGHLLRRPAQYSNNSSSFQY